MKNVAILAILGVLAGTVSVANAQSDSLPNLTLAYNGNTIANTWLEAAPEKTAEAVNPAEDLFDSEAMNDSIEQLSEKLNKKLEDKIAQEIDYAMH